MISWYDTQYKLESLKGIMGGLVLPVGVSTTGSITCCELSTNALYDNILVSCEKISCADYILHYVIAAGMFLHGKKLRILYVSSAEEEVAAVAHLKDFGLKAFYTPTVPVFNVALDDIYAELHKDDGEHLLLVIMAVKNDILLDDVACTVLAFHQMFNVAGTTGAHFIVVQEDTKDATVEKRVSPMAEWRHVYMDVENPRRAYVVVNKQPMQITVPWTTTVNISHVATSVYI